MPQTVSCPRCGGPMGRAHFTPPDGPRLDVYECDECAWFIDVDEFGKPVLETAG